MAKKKIKGIVWSENAWGDFNQIMEYLSEHAPSAVDIVGNGLLNIIGELATEYNHYPPDRLKDNNDSTFKAAVKFSYRISYRIETENVYILRIRHTSREPLNY